MCRLFSSFLLIVLTSIGAPGILYGGSATWTSNPTSGDWTTASNWTPATVPNGKTDTATFAASNTTAISIPTAVEVQGIVFNPNASSFTITPMQSLGLIISGIGIINDSAAAQTFVTTATESEVFFENSASAGTSTVFSNTGGATAGLPGGETVFAGNSSADHSTCISKGGLVNGALGGTIFFNESATADQGTFSANGGAVAGANGGEIMFLRSSTAANGVFTISASTVSSAFGGIVDFFDTSTAADGTFTIAGTPIGGSDSGAVLFSSGSTAGNASFSNNGSAVTQGIGGKLAFIGTSTAANAVIVDNGGTVNGALGGQTSFSDSSTAGSAVLTANGGINGGLGGSIFFFSGSTGGQAQVELFDNGSLDISVHPLPGVTIGSIEGTGLVVLGANNLTIGTNNLSKTFSGLIQGSGSVTKLGTGTLTLSGANTYTGTTSVTAGVLTVGNKTGSATGTGAVNVTAGTLVGRGTLSGATTIGTGSGSGAFLAPSAGTNQPAPLTLKGGLTFKSDSSYMYQLNTKKAKADEVIAKGVTIESGAQFAFTAVANKKLPTGTVFTAISNTSTTPIAGTFVDLPDGSTFTSGRNSFKASYSGGTGNDLTLTVQ